MTDSRETFICSTESRKTMELHNSLLPCWHMKDTNVFAHMHAHSHGKTTHTQVHLHLQMQTHKHREAHTHTHFAGVYLLFRTAVVLRMSWRCQCWQWHSISTSLKNIRTSLFYCPRLCRGKGCGSFSFMLWYHMLSAAYIRLLKIKVPDLNKQSKNLQFTK